METQSPLAPFTDATARQKVRLAEDTWNTRDPDRVVLVHTEDTRWRNRSDFPVGREQVRQFLQRKCAKELDYRLTKELWAFNGNRIAVRFAYGEYQRPSDPRGGPQIPLDARPTPGRSSGIERSGVVARLLIYLLTPLARPFNSLLLQRCALSSRFAGSGRGPRAIAHRKNQAMFCALRAACNRTSRSITWDQPR